MESNQVNPGLRHQGSKPSHEIQWTPPKRQEKKLNFSLAVTEYARVRVNQHEKQRVHPRCFSRIINRPVDL
jgi:hypothetical protein